MPTVWRRAGWSRNPVFLRRERTPPDVRPRARQIASFDRRPLPPDPRAVLPHERHDSTPNVRANLDRVTDGVNEARDDVFVMCPELGIDMPDSFPCDRLALLRQTANERFLPEKPPSWVECVRASNLIGWRYRTFVESAQTVLTSPRTLEDIFQHEQTLFLAMCSAASCVEAAGYATYALASDSTVLDVPFGGKEQRYCSPKMLHEMLSVEQVDGLIVEPWHHLLEADEWTLVTELRNRMIHRSNVPQIVTASTAPPSPQPDTVEYAATSSTRAFRIDEIKALEPWLASTVTALIDSAIELLNRYSGQ